jgi:DNA replication protein DnaC
LEDVFEQFIIDGYHPHGYYFYGNIGVGKTTLISSIAKILKTFLFVEIKYITMTRLVRLITSIDFDDKNKISRLENCQILFVDDMGIEKYTTDTQEAFIRDFFTYRYGNGLLNILAGNIDIRTQQKQNSFFRQLSDYINDSKQYKIIEMAGKSKRT